MTLALGLLMALFIVASTADKQSKQVKKNQDEANCNKCMRFYLSESENTVITDINREMRCPCNAVFNDDKSALRPQVKEDEAEWIFDPTCKIRKKNHKEERCRFTKGAFGCLRSRQDINGIRQYCCYEKDGQDFYLISPGEKGAGYPRHEDDGDSLRACENCKDLSCGMKMFEQVRPESRNDKCPIKVKKNQDEANCNKCMRFYLSESENTVITDINREMRCPCNAVFNDDKSALRPQVKEDEAEWIFDPTCKIRKKNHKEERCRFTKGAFGCLRSRQDINGIRQYCCYEKDGQDFYLISPGEKGAGYPRHEDDGDSLRACENCKDLSCGMKMFEQVRPESRNDKCPIKGSPSVEEPVEDPVEEPAVDEETLKEIKENCTKCKTWNKEEENIDWLTQLHADVPCPCKVQTKGKRVVPLDNPGAWSLDPACKQNNECREDKYPAEAFGCIRSAKSQKGHSQHCCYDKDLNLIDFALPEKVFSRSNTGESAKDQNRMTDKNPHIWCCRSCNEENSCQKYTALRHGDETRVAQCQGML